MFSEFTQWLLLFGLIGMTLVLAIFYWVTERHARLQKLLIAQLEQSLKNRADIIDSLRAKILVSKGATEESAKLQVSNMLR